jgi:cytoskeletal protein CcmA (bactofilin family)
MDEKDTKPDKQADENLDAKATDKDGTIDNPDELDPNSERAKKAQAALTQGPVKRVVGLIKSVNIYLIGFIVIFVIALVVIYVALSAEDTGPTITGQDLTQDQLDELINQESNVGDVSQTLTVEANAIFNGKVLVKDNLDVAGSINVGGPLTLPGITVAGTSAFDNVEVSSDLAVLGSSSIQGTLVVSSALTVNGDASIGGDLSANSITVSNLSFSGDLQLSRHIDTGGPSPNISSGGSVGAGGTVSLSGTDTSGTVTINTGGGPSSGTLATITFSRNFNSTPQVVITPVGASGSTINYYVTRTTTGFTVRSQDNPNASTTYVFDYWIAE